MISEDIEMLSREGREIPPMAQVPLDRRARTLVGAEELRKWLMEQGFRCEESPLRYQDNGCNWYAYRRSELSARRCECNDDKPGMQIVVTPSEVELNGKPYRSCEIELCGEVGGVWWKMTACSLKPEEVPGKMSEVERALIAAWNALHPNT